MSSAIPTVRQIAWISAIPQFLFMGLLTFVWYLIYPEDAFLYGAITYLIFSFSLKTMIPIDHRKGLKEVKSGNFNAAIPYFEKSYDFFTKYEWLDKYRYILLLDSSKVPYREMALINIALCYGQTGNGKKAKETYERTLAEFPDSGFAIAGLRLLNSMVSAKE